MKTLLIFFTSFVVSTQTLANKTDLQDDSLYELSRAMGHVIGENLKSLGVPLDHNALAKGLQESSDGINPPLNEEECIEALSILHEEALMKEATANLTQAIDFLESNAKKEAVHVLENGKIQYQIVKQGSGETVRPYHTPLVRYQGRFLNGELFGTSHGEEVLDPDTALLGLSQGIVGMKEGEVRTLFIHPDLGFSEMSLSSPNALAIFEVELIQVDAKPLLNESLEITVPPFPIR